MNDLDLMELCKEVYERTRWFGTDQQFQYSKGGSIITVHSNGKPYKLPSGTLTNIPLYTSDYLLEKLPRTLVFPWDLHCVGVDDGYSYVAEARIKDGEAGYTKKMSEADTPLKALLKLVIALDDAGELSHV